MNYDDFIRELSRSPTHASLAPSDLEDMAKRASGMYLSYDTPLTDAVVKVAQGCPGISPEQVKRIVEMTNTSTFQRLFEKNAGDKNISFTIADPNEVLRRLNSGASAPIVKVAADYASRPPVSKIKDLEADMALCDVFGVTPSPTESMTKSAMLDPARGSAALELLARKEQTLKAQKKVIEMQMQPPEPVGPPDMQQLGSNMRPPMPMGMGKMGSDGASALMEVTAAIDPRMQALLDQEIEDRAQTRLVHSGLGGALSGGLKGGLVGAGLGGILGAIGTVRDGRGSVGMLGRRILGGLGGAMAGAVPGATIGAVGGGVGGVWDALQANKRQLEAIKALQKEGMVYIKTGRQDADLVEQDLRSQFSLDAIKTAVRSKETHYPEANPFGDLIRTRQDLSKQAEDVSSAISENEYHLKTAQTELNHHILQHVLDGGNLGEVVHLLSGLGSDEQVKTAMENLAPELERRLADWQLNEVQVDLIEYEMTKGASARVVNPDHPISQAFAGVLKLSDDDTLLKQAQTQIISLLDEANRLVVEAAKTRV